MKPTAWEVWERVAQEVIKADIQSRLGDAPTDKMGGIMMVASLGRFA